MQSTGYSSGPVILVGVIAGILFAIFAIRSQRFVPRFALTLVALCLLLPSGLLFVARNPAIVDVRYRTFRLLYWNFGIGMSREEVFASLAKRYPPGHEAKAPRVVVDNGSTLEFVMTPDYTGLPANERIILKTDAGVVTGKDYLPDR